MIEINLVPDVKQQALRAQAQRNAVISIAMLVAIIAGALVGVTAFYVFGVQTARTYLADNAIKDGEKKLKSVKDLDKALTFQNQLSQISAVHEKTGVESRVFELLVATLPNNGEVEVRVKSILVDTTEKKVTIEAESPQGFKGQEVYVKTIEATRYAYATESDKSEQKVPVTDKVNIGERSYGIDETTKQQSLRFTLSFTYNEVLFSRTAKNGKFEGPAAKNVTDSALSIPITIFTSGGNN